MRSRRFELMGQKTTLKVSPLIGLTFGGVGISLPSWANDKEQDVIIEEKVNEAFATCEYETPGSEEP